MVSFVTLHPMKNKFSVAVAHGYFLIRTGIKGMLHKHEKFVLNGIAENEDSLKTALQQSEIDLLIIDHTSDGFSLSTLQWVRTQYPLIQILSISNDLDKGHFSDAMQTGVGSFVLAECNDDEIFEAFSSILGGKDFMCGKIVDFLNSPAGALKSARCEGVILTERELDILKLIAEGNSNKQMADILFLSPHTINTHRKNIMAKLQVNNTAGLVMYAVKENLLDRNKFLFS